MVVVIKLWFLEAYRGLEYRILFVWTPLKASISRALVVKSTNFRETVMKEELVVHATVSDGVFRMTHEKVYVDCCI